jgi:predicted membrane channel-forming protein YqfA (hemolysin III family)
VRALARAWKVSFDEVFAYASVSTWHIYAEGSRSPTAKLLNVVTNLPNTIFISGRAVPAAMAAINDTVYRSRVVVSA